MNQRTKTILKGATALALVGLVAGCDFLGGGQQQASEPVVNVPSVDPNDRLDGLFDARPVQPARITASAQRIELRLPPGGSDRAAVRFINEGEKDARIRSIIAGTATDEMTLGGSCLTLDALSGGRACDVTIQYNDTSSRSFSTTLLFFTEAEQGSDIRIPVEVVIQQVSDPSRDATAPVEEERIIAEVYNPLAEEIARMRSERLARGAGRWTGRDRPPEVSTRMVDRSEGYDRQVFASVETSLPVDRSRILTPDRVIPAILETPIHSPITGNIVAVTSSHVYAPTGDRILIPAGSRFIGRTNGFADERAALVWERFITPDGITVRMNGATQDQMGRAGAVGYVDRRMWDRYGLPLLFSSLQAIATFSFGDDSSVTRDQEGNVFEQRTARSEAIGGFRQDVEGIAEDLINELRDVRRIVSVPAGTRINIAPTEDLYFTPNREIVTVNNIEYELRQQDRRPVIGEAPAQMFEADAARIVTNPSGFSGDGAIVTLGNREFKLVPLSEADLEARRRGTSVNQNEFRPVQPGQMVNQGDPRLVRPVPRDPNLQGVDTGAQGGSPGGGQRQDGMVVQPAFDDGYFRSAPR